MNSPHSKQLKYSTISTEPLLVKLLETVDQHQQSGDDAPRRQGGNHHVQMEPRRGRAGSSEVRGENGAWTSQFISLTDMAGWMAASPWYKWKMKGRFPVKLFLHIAIAFLSLFQIVFLSTNTGRVIRNTKTLVDELLTPASSPVFNLTSLIRATNETICGTCAYEQDSLTKFRLNQPFRLQLKEIKDGGQIYNRSTPSFNMASETKAYELNCSLCPYNLLANTDLDTDNMDNTQRQRLRHSLTELSIHFGMEQFTFLEQGRYCLDWSIDLIYDLTLRRGDLVKPLIKKRADGCGHWPTEPMNIPLVWVNIWLLLFSCLSFLLIMRQLGRQFLLYSTVKKEIKNIEMRSTREARVTLNSWSSLANKKKIKFFSAWPLFTLATNLAQILGSSILISHRGKSGSLFITGLIGLASSGALLNMVRYFRFFPKSYLLILTLKYALPKSLRFILCAGVIYLAYAVLGMALFGDGSSEFADLGASFQTLFAIVNGDNITVNVQTMATASNSFIARAYCFSFVFLCMWVSLNILLALVIEGYNQAVEQVNRIAKENGDTGEEIRTIDMV